MSTHHTDAALVTYAGAASAAVGWGLHVSDIAVIISATAAVAGVVLQFYVTWHQIRGLQRNANIQTVATAATVVAAAATNARVKAVETEQAKKD